MEAEPAPGALASPRARDALPFEFRATGAEYFRIWIVNLALTLLTLGMYSAWAKVRRLRYFYGNTFIAGSAFEYHGRPVQILKGRLIAVAVVAVYWILTNVWPISVLLLLPLIAFGLPWVVVRSRLFQMHMTSWRNVRFRFHGTYGSAFVAYVGWAFLAFISGYLLTPWWLQRRVSFLMGNTAYGSERFVFEKPAGPYVRFYYKSVLMGCVAGFIAMLALAFGVVRFPWTETAAGTYTFDGVALLPFLPFAGAIALVALLIFAFYQKSFVNTSFDGLRIGPNRIRCELQTQPLMWIHVTNALAMAVTLGLFHPWAKVRRLRYQFECMSLQIAGSLDPFTAAVAQGSSAVGDELGEFFDVDFGL